MSLVNIISAIGNNSSIYPLIVRDCGIEVPTKVAMTYNQNLKDSKQMALNATRERLIDEYGTSIVWLGGIPFIDKICDWGIKKLGYNPDINSNLLKKSEQQGLEFNIDKFKKSAPEEVKELEKVLKNKSTYQKLLAGKFLLSTVIPVAIMGYVLPKLNFALTDKIRNKQAKESEKNNAGEVSFKGITSSLSSVSTVHKMALTDGGLTLGRVGTARNRYEAMENGFRMSMMMILNFIFPIYLAKFLDKTSSKLFNTNVNLDPKLFANKDFIESIKNKTLEIPDNKNIIEFLDKNPDSPFAKLCENYCGVKYLKNRIRDPRSFVDTRKIIEFKNEIEKFTKQASNSQDINKFAKKALKVKSANILANIGISSFLLAIALPKLTFMLRKAVTGSEAEPGLVGLENQKIS